MAKKTEQTEERIPRWELKVDYVESCNCNFGCPCNFSGYPTDGFCEALVGYHIRQGRFGRTRLDGLDVIYAAAWPKAIHQGGGTLRLYVSEAASAEQRDALVRIFSGKAKGSGAFELFGSTMADIQPPVFTAIEFTPAGRQSSFRVPGALEVQLAPFTNPVSGEVQDVRVNLPKGFIFRSAQAARTLVMTILGTGPLSFDHAGRRARRAGDRPPGRRRPARRRPRRADDGRPPRRWPRLEPERASLHGDAAVAQAARARHAAGRDRARDRNRRVGPRPAPHARPLAHERYGARPRAAQPRRADHRGGRGVGQRRDHEPGLRRGERGLPSGGAARRGGRSPPELRGRGLRAHARAPRHGDDGGRGPRRVGRRRLSYFFRQCGG